MRVRVVKAKHGEPAAAGLTPRLDVRLRLDEKPVRVVGNVSRADGFRDRRAVAEEQPAAFGGPLVPRVGDDLRDRGPGHPNRYNASTAIAMPIPPPIQSDATPYR